MVDNPDPKRYKVKKLRNGPEILVDRQVYLWRAKNKRRAKQAAIAAKAQSEAQALESRLKALLSEILGPATPPNTKSPWDMFK